MDAEPRFLDPLAEVTRHANRLPHWQQREATYFVTFRLADSLPAERLEQWQAERDAWSRWNPPPWSLKQEREYRERFTAAIERWLDDGHGKCILRHPPFAQVVGEALHYFDGIHYHQHAWVVMPNHVHLLFTLLGETSLQSQLRSWKGFTARMINREAGRTGPVWQKDYHDRLVRNLRHFENCIRYISENPAKAGLQEGGYLLYRSAAARELMEGRSL